jgi:hypothetical protein
MTPTWKGAHMKRAILILAIAALVLPTTALGKGPSGASINGPGDGGGITFTGDGEDAGSGLGNLTDQAGFFPAVFGQEPTPMLAGRPKGDLGPKYTITYTVPGPANEPDKLHQDLYPYAASGPVTYMEPGQKFFGTDQTRGGWFQASPELKQTLVSAGLPARAPSGSSERWSFPRVTASVLALMLLLGLTAGLVRRRIRPTARMAGSPT